MHISNRFIIYSILAIQARLTNLLSHLLSLYMYVCMCVCESISFVYLFI